MNKFRNGALTVALIATIAVAARGVAQKFAETRPGPGMLVLRGFEVAAAALVFAFGLVTVSLAYRLENTRLMQVWEELRQALRGPAAAV